MFWYEVLRDGSPPDCFPKSRPHCAAPPRPESFRTGAGRSGSRRMPLSVVTITRSAGRFQKPAVGSIIVSEKDWRHPRKRNGRILVLSFAVRDGAVCTRSALVVMKLFRARPATCPNAFSEVRRFIIGAGDGALMTKGTTQRRVRAWRASPRVCAILGIPEVAAVRSTTGPATGSMALTSFGDALGRQRGRDQHDEAIATAVRWRSVDLCSHRGSICSVGRATAALFLRCRIIERRPPSDTPCCYLAGGRHHRRARQPSSPNPRRISVP